MANSVYQINKGINKPLEFKGIKAQYIGYMAAGLVALLLVFAILYILGVNVFVCLVLVGASGSFLFSWVMRCSHKYGRYGMMKKAARNAVPAWVAIRSRKIFLNLLKNQQCQNQ